MKMCMFLYFHVNFIHESTQTCMFPCKFAFFYPPIHHNGKGSNMGYHLESDHSGWQPATCTLYVDGCRSLQGDTCFLHGLLHLVGKAVELLHSGALLWIPVQLCGLSS